jgi:plastocyanin
MHHKTSLTSTILVLLAALALIAATGCPSHASASQSANSGKTASQSESAAPKVVTVLIRDFKFEPATVTVHEGETVEWKNEDSVPHTATENADGKKPAFDSGYLQTGAAWRYVAQNKGTYNYICTLHPNMQGTLIIQ